MSFSKRSGVDTSTDIEVIPSPNNDDDSGHASDNAAAQRKRQRDVGSSLDSNNEVSTAEGDSDNDEQRLTQVELDDEAFVIASKERERMERNPAFNTAKKEEPNSLLLATRVIDHWPQDWDDKEDLQKALDEIKLIPYMKECLQGPLKEAEHLLANYDFKSFDGVLDEQSGEDVLPPNEDAFLSDEDVLLSDEDAFLSDEDKKKLNKVKVMSEENYNEMKKMIVEDRKAKEKAERRAEKAERRAEVERRRAEVERRRAEKAKRRAEKAKRREEIASVKAAAVDCLFQVQIATKKVEVQLLVMAGLNQNSGTTTGTGTSQQLDPEQESAKRSKQQQTLLDNRPSSGRDGIEYARTDKIFEDLFAAAEVLPALKLLEGRPLVNCSEFNKLSNVVTQLNNYLSEANLLSAPTRKSNDRYKEKIINGLDWLRKAVKGEGCGCINNGVAAPGPRASEVLGTQPYVEVLLKMIGSCLEPSGSAKTSPVKNQIRAEAPIPAIPGRSGRRVDFMVNKAGLWHPIVFDDLLTIPVEVKTGCRLDKGPMQLLAEGRDQVLGHLAKYLFVGFKFAGFGVPCHATGVVANMAAVQFLSLQYTNVGKPGATLVLRQSGFLPLMARNTFQRWAAAAGSKWENHFTSLESELYESNEYKSIETNGVPLGMLCLLSMMNKPSKELYGLWVEAKADGLGEVLGSGACAVVFRRSSEAHDSAIKVSRYGVKDGIENERRILAGLSHTNLPSLVHDPLAIGGELEITVGCVQKRLPAVETTPVGVKAVAVCLSKSGDEHIKYLRLVHDGINSALDFLHEKEIGHCDVSPKNIIIAKNKENGKERAILIDFSIASEIGTKRYGFWGTPSFAHRAIFMASTKEQIARQWEVRPEHDLAGLGFTLAFFASGCLQKLSVSNLPRSGATMCEVNSVMDGRFEEAKSSVDGLFEDAKSSVKEHCLGKKIKELLDNDLKSK